MKLFTLALLLIASVSQASVQRVTWTHDGKNNDGSAQAAVTFRLYWWEPTDANGTPKNEQVIEMGAVTPATIDPTTGVKSYDLSMSKPEWLAGKRLCFSLSVLAAYPPSTTAVESDRYPAPTAGQLCKIMPTLRPNAAKALRFDNVAP